MLLTDRNFNTSSLDPPLGPWPRDPQTPLSATWPAPLPAPAQLLDDPLSAVDPRVGRILFDQCIGNAGLMAGGHALSARRQACAGGGGRSRMRGCRCACCLCHRNQSRAQQLLVAARHCAAACRPACCPFCREHPPAGHAPAPVPARLRFNPGAAGRPGGLQVGCSPGRQGCA